MSKSTPKSADEKPTRKKTSLKPYETFPLTAHPSGRWVKKHRGRAYYFGPLDDWESALAKFNHDWPYTLQGKTPPPMDDDALTVAELANAFLNSKRNQLQSAELSRQSFQDYHHTCKLLVDQFGKHQHVDALGPSDFEKFRKKLSARYSISTLKNEINRVRIVMKYAWDQRLISEPIHFGQSFKKPTAKTLRQVRNESGQRMFEAAELRKIIKEADPVLQAMVLLGCTCGFGNTDCADLPAFPDGSRFGWKRKLR